MATIAVERPHKLGQEEALKRAQELLQSFGARLGADVEWNGPHATFKGSGFFGSALVAADKVQVSIDLSLLLRAMKGKIESRLTRAMEERFS